MTVSLHEPSKLGPAATTSFSQKLPSQARAFAAAPVTANRPTINPNNLMKQLPLSASSVRTTDFLEKASTCDFLRLSWQASLRKLPCFNISPIRGQRDKTVKLRSVDFRRIFHSNNFHSNNKQKPAQGIPIARRGSQKAYYSPVPMSAGNAGRRLPASRTPSKRLF
jgi:hypothetical protein